MSRGSLGAPFGNRLSSPTETQEGLGPTGFDPARVIVRVQRELHLAPLSFEGEDVEYAFREGLAYGLKAAEDIARRWAAENRDSAAKARNRGRGRYSFDGDGTSLVMAQQLEGAAIECNAIAAEIHKLRDSDGSGEASETAKTGSTEGDSAGPKGIAQPNSPTESSP